MKVRGAALLLVLWLIALLTALVGGFALSARIEHLQGQVLSRGVVATQAARAGVEYAITRVGSDDPRWRWLADGRAYRWQLSEADGADAQVEVRIIDEQGKIDLNAADADLLASLFRVLGSERDEATQLAAAILDWRDTDTLTQPSGGAEDGNYAEAGRPYGAKDAPFESVAELQQVLGMTPALYAQAAPHLTVFSGRMRPDPAFASSEVLAAMGYDAAQVIEQRQRWDPASGQPPPVLQDGQPLVGSNSGTYSIQSRARLRSGRTAVLRVVVRTGGNGVPGSAWTPLRWEEGASPR
ncbi:MAG: type II secretion system minor pseudopilin GspK [Luteimonas sp.]